MNCTFRILNVDLAVDHILDSESKNTNIFLDEANDDGGHIGYTHMSYHLSTHHYCHAHGSG